MRETGTVGLIGGGDGGSVSVLSYAVVDLRVGESCGCARRLFNCKDVARSLLASRAKISRSLSLRASSSHLLHRGGEDGTK